MTDRTLFPGPLVEVHEALRRAVLGLGDDVREEFATTQVSYGALRTFVWLTPLTKSKALLLVDLWEERSAPFVRGTIRYRDDKTTHEIEVRTAADVDTVVAAGWLVDAYAWGRRSRP